MDSLESVKKCASNTKVESLILRYAATLNMAMSLFVDLSMGKLLDGDFPCLCCQDLKLLLLF